MNRPRLCAHTFLKVHIIEGSRFPVAVVDIRTRDQLISRTVNVKVDDNNNNNCNQQ